MKSKATSTKLAAVTDQDQQAIGKLINVTSAQSVLVRRYDDNQPVQGVGDEDLAGQA